MPYKPKKPCYVAGCPNLVEYNQKYCAEHLYLKKQTMDKYNRELRKTDNSFYKSKEWINCKTQYLLLHPACEVCRKKGIVAPAVHVHHIKEISSGGAPLDFRNLQAVCKSCHSKIHASRLTKKKVYTY